MQRCASDEMTSQQVRRSRAISKMTESKRKNIAKLAGSRESKLQDDVADPETTPFLLQGQLEGQLEGDEGR